MARSFGRGISVGSFLRAVLGVIVCAELGWSAPQTTLDQVCGPKGGRSGDSQADQLCRAAYSNGEAWIAHDNNSRIWAPVAIVCGYTCIAGFGGSCSGSGARGQAASNSNSFQNQLGVIGTGGEKRGSGGGSGGSGGGGSCSTAVHAGRQAYDSDKDSDHDLDAAKKNGSKALSLLGGKAPQWSDSERAKAKGRGDALGDGSENSGIPEVCARAGKSGSVQDRIDCAVATDPSIPSFVRTPEFQAEFKQITGFSLQEVINKSPSTLMNSYVPAGLKNAYSLTQGKFTFSQFIKGGADLIKEIAASFSNPADSSRFLAQALPAGLSNLVSGAGAALAGGELLKKEEGKGESAQEPAPAPGGSATEAVALLRAPASSAGAEEDPRISLFERVSARYRTNLDRVSHIGWSLKMNQH